MKLLFSLLLSIILSNCIAQKSVVGKFSSSQSFDKVFNAASAAIREIKWSSTKIDKPNGILKAQHSIMGGQGKVLTLDVVIVQQDQKVLIAATFTKPSGVSDNMSKFATDYGDEIKKQITDLEITVEEAQPDASSESPNSSSDKDCRPDISTTDKLTKEALTAWGGEIYEYNTLSSISSTDVYIDLQVANLGKTNYIEVVIRKYEAYVANATYDQSLKAQEGKEVVFGLAGNPPVRLTISEVKNEQKFENINSRVETRVTLRCKISDDQLPNLSQQLTSSPIDFVQLNLANGTIIERSIKEKRGIGMQEKFLCYFEFLKKSGFKVE